MVTYISLSTFTDQGIRTVKDSVKRSDAVKEGAKKFGVNVKELYWTVGSYDLVGVFEAEDEKTMMAFALMIGIQGNVRSQSLRAYNHDEMQGILTKMG